MRHFIVAQLFDAKLSEKAKDIEFVIKEDFDYYMVTSASQLSFAVKVSIDEDKIEGIAEMHATDVKSFKKGQCDFKSLV